MFLKKWNPAYRNIDISTDNLNLLPLNDSVYDNLSEIPINNNNNNNDNDINPDNNNDDHDDDDDDDDGIVGGPIENELDAALIELKLIDSLLQSTEHCRQMLWNSADQFQTDRVPAAAALPSRR
jgi:hypothetical protein